MFVTCVTVFFDVVGRANVQKMMRFVLNVPRQGIKENNQLRKLANTYGGAY